MVKHSDKTTYSLNTPVLRYPNNPIITPHDVNQVWTNPAHQVVTVHNAGITQFHKETIMLFRAHLRNGISVIGLAISPDGLTNWQISATPILKPATAKDIFAPNANAKEIITQEAGGIEDPRISHIDNNYVITYSAYSATTPDKVRIHMATTTDFKTFTRHGTISHRDMRNVVIFPEKINNQYYGLFRPNTALTQIKLGTTNDYTSNNWHFNHQPIMQTGRGPSAFNNKIGPGATPIKTKHGWISIFHGVRQTMAANPYVLGVMLHDLNNPNQVQISDIPILFPTASDCKIDEQEYIHVPQVVFTCGATRHDDGTIYIYYGGNDTVMNVGVTHEDVLIELCTKYSQNPHTGQPLYQL